MSHQHAQTIDSLLADPLIQMVMRADKVEPEAVKGLLVRAHARTDIGRRKPAFAFSQASVRFGAEARSPEPLLLSPPKAYRGGDCCLFC